MEFVILLVVLMNHNDGSVFVRAVPTPNHQVCEETRRAVLAQLAPEPEGLEARLRCISSEQLVPSV